MKQKSGKDVIISVQGSYTGNSSYELSTNLTIIFANNRFVKELKLFHRLNDEYFTETTELMYDGDNITIEYKGVNGNAKIVRKKSFAEQRFNTKLSYIPAERNLISAIQNVDKTYKTTERDVLFNFIYEWDEAKTPYTSEHPFRLAATGGFSYVNKSGADVLVRDDG